MLHVIFHLQNCILLYFYFVLIQSKLAKYDIWITNLLKCSTEDNSLPTDIQFNACKYHLKEEINAIKPDYIVAMGTIVVKYLEKLKLYHRIFSVKHPSFYYRFKTQAAVDKSVMELDKVYREIIKDN